MTPRQQQMLQEIERSQVSGHRGFRGASRLVFAAILKKGWIECREDGRWHLTQSGFEVLHPPGKSDPALNKFRQTADEIAGPIAGREIRKPDRRQKPRRRRDR